MTDHYHNRHGVFRDGYLVGPLVFYTFIVSKVMLMTALIVMYAFMY